MNYEETNLPIVGGGDILADLLFNCTLMFSYLVDAGKTLPSWVGVKLIEIEKKKNILLNYSETADEKSGRITAEMDGYITELTKIYKELAVASSPATPKSLRDTMPTKKMFYLWGTKCIPFMRNLWIASLFFLMGFIITGSLDAIYKTDVTTKQLFLIFSSGLGAYFYSLYTVKRYIVHRTFDDRYINHYYNRIVIGILAGFILANIFNATILPGQKDNLLANLTPSLIGLLGGYSAEAVVKILNRFVSMLTTLVEGEIKDIVEAKEQEIKNKYEANKIRESSNLAVELEGISGLPALKQDVGVQEKIKELISGLLEKKNI